MERLDKLLANTGKWSRKEARLMIQSGRVQVEGQFVRDIGSKFLENAVILVGGEAISGGKYRYIMLHKPQGVVSATEDRVEKTVLDLLPAELQNIGLFPVGRLDKDTVGLLILTNDGALSHRLLSPKHHVEKSYYGELARPISEETIPAFQEGLVLGDGTKCLPAKLRILQDGMAFHVTIAQGIYHQVRRMMAASGSHVTYLKRLSMGELFLDDALSEGKWRFLTENEVKILQKEK